MAKAKIYIASSENGKLLAEILRDQLDSGDLDPRVWWDEVDRGGGPTGIEKLESESKTYDFAVIVLTEADFVIGRSDAVIAGRAHQKSRDDCVFEAGLFLSSLGRKQCFLVSSAPPDELPSDFRGIDLLSFDEPP